MNKPQSIYKSPEVEANLMEMYDAKLEQWPVPYESVFVDDPIVLDRCGEWFREIMNAIVPAQTRPKTFTPEQLKNLTVPTLHC